MIVCKLNTLCNKNDQECRNRDKSERRKKEIDVNNKEEDSKNNMKKSIRRFLPVFTLSIILTGCNSDIVVKNSNKPNNTEESQKVSLDKSKFPTFFSNSEESSENKVSSEEKKAESTNKSESDMNSIQKENIDKENSKEEQRADQGTKLRQYLRTESTVSKMMQGKTIKEQEKLESKIESTDNKKLNDISKKAGFEIVDQMHKTLKSKNNLEFSLNFYGYEYDKLIQVSLLVPKGVDSKIVFEDLKDFNKAIGSIDLDQLQSMFDDVNKKELESVKKGGVWGSDLKRATIIESTDNIEYEISRYETGEYYIALKIV